MKIPPLHLEVLPDRQQNLFNLLTKEDWINSFYLAGGTSLALRIGHRQSIDFDFFIQEDFKIRKVINHLRQLGSFELFNEAENTINGFLNYLNFLKLIAINMGLT